MTNVWAVSMVRDEEDVLEATVRNMAGQVDGLIVSDNGSVDGTRDLLARLGAELPVPLVVVDDPEPGYYQSAKMTGLARRAVTEFGATWVVPFDADEWWYCVQPMRIADWLESRVSARTTGVTAAIYDHVATGEDNPAVGYPDRMPWRRQHRLPLHKMAGRGDPRMVVTQGNHHVRFDDGATVAQAQRGLEVRHFPYRCVAQLIRKVRNGAAAYAATVGLPEDAGAHWRKWGRFSDEQIKDVFLDWYFHPQPRSPRMTSGGDVLPPLVYDPAPRR